MASVSYHADLAEVQDSDGLAAIARAADAPFSRLEWFTGLAEHCKLPARWLGARSKNAATVWPLLVQRRQASALVNWYSFFWEPLDSSSDATELYADCARALRRHAWRLDLAPLAVERGTVAALNAAFRAAGWRVELSPLAVNRALEVGALDAAGYLRSLPGPLRTTLKRKGKALKTVICERWSEEAWDTYCAIYRESWKPEEIGLNFLEHFARGEAAAGRLRLGLAFHGDRAVAAQLWTVDHDTAYIHKLAHRQDADGLSPGTVLTAAMMQFVIDQDRVASVDFGTGDDAYKRDWMNQARPRWRLEAFDPRSPRARIYLALRAAKRLVRGLHGG